MSKDLEVGGWLQADFAYHGDSAEMLHRLEAESVSLSIWSPPYHVGKGYELGQTFANWQKMLREVISAHYRILKPGGFCVININDILCFSDPEMPKIQAETISQKRINLTKEEILDAIAELGTRNRDILAKHFNVSEQTIDRRLNGNNIRGGKYSDQTRVKEVGGLIETFGLDAGLYLYDRRIWMKDPAWANSRWASSSYRAIDDFEYLYFLWKPGITVVDRNRLTNEEWSSWGSRGIWTIPSVRANNDHEAKFPIELPTRVIRLLTKENDLVLDPFVGSGTTMVASAALNRRVIGIDLDKKYVAMANKAFNAARNKGFQQSLEM